VEKMEKGKHIKEPVVAGSTKERKGVEVSYTAYVNYYSQRLIL